MGSLLKKLSYLKIKNLNFNKKTLLKYIEKVEKTNIFIQFQYKEFNLYGI